MSKAYELISESLNEIIRDLEENDGKNLKREVIIKKKEESNNVNRIISARRADKFERNDYYGQYNNI